MTLRMIHENPNAGYAVFGTKEVLLKIIEKPVNANTDALLEFIESISDATNQQSRIVEADRRANDPKLLNCRATSSKGMACFLSASAVSFSTVLTPRLSRRPASSIASACSGHSLPSKGNPQRLAQLRTRCLRRIVFRTFSLTLTLRKSHVHTSRCKQ